MEAAKKYTLPSYLNLESRSHQPHDLPKEQVNHTALEDITVVDHSSGISIARKFP